jgi:hypothetical protein
MNKKAGRLFVLARDKHTCQYCLKQPETLTLDHVLPKSQGGMRRRDNLVACCWDCNDTRRDMELTQWCEVVGGMTGQKCQDILDRVSRQLRVSVEFEKEGISSKEQLKRVGAIGCR